MPEPEVLVALECRVTVATGTMECSYPEEDLAGSAIRTTRIFAGQNKFIKLTNFGNVVESDVLSMFVTVQNLLADPLGTPDGVTVEGIKIFFAEDPSNGVTIANATGTDMFTAPNQAYFLYNEILTTYQVSAPVQWQFDLNGASTFTFKVLVSASQPDESGDGLDLVWNGTTTDWFTAGNWKPMTVPVDTSVVQIPSTATTMPVLSADTAVKALYMGAGSTLGLGGNDLEVKANLAANGTISNGSITMSGTGALLNGNLATLFVTGSTRLQGATRTTGPVSVTGSLTVADSAMSISIP